MALGPRNPSAIGHGFAVCPIVGGRFGLGLSFAFVDKSKAECLNRYAKRGKVTKKIVCSRPTK